VGTFRLGVTTAEQAREALDGAGGTLIETWDADLGGDKPLVVEGLQSMTPNLGLHYGELAYRAGAANKDRYLMLKLRFARVGGSEPVLYFMSVTTRADESTSVCTPASSLAESLSQQKRPTSPPNLPGPRVKETRYTFYPCTEDGRTVIVNCDDGNVKVSFNGVKYPLRTVEYEMLVVE
jgi:hypothetical protein